MLESLLFVRFVCLQRNSSHFLFDSHEELVFLARMNTIDRILNVRNYTRPTFPFMFLVFLVSTRSFNFQFLCLLDLFKHANASLEYFKLVFN